ncbi:MULTISPECIES: TetR family transcriptional regulator [unclassified Micromonospora]|uniref:TetR/AcrR family transcriptional regulator n=1 Tax=unclassified Micromonospora TaxID=2617518 RepID=UPI00188E2E06|nr:MULTISPECIES: TetR family transcriptional regulator [unclassified Micromonospora]MBF5033121.1 TetR family transcriptional regulator [Micromonospora sp. ANENR4]MCZ7476177.1 TetR family transcriptional regulator [Micromonospora sp. WMMC273]WBC01037.1 TetR family transcriptional regulator [Micromonospora sp. WMMA1976]
MSRRSPSGDQRRRDAERTRERILDAALVEFGEYGFAGARTGAIAARAGVNQQLISYYFAGKEGLYQALHQRWRSTSGAARPDQPLADVVAGFVRLGATQRSWARLLVWEGLADAGTTDADDDESDSQAYFTAMVDDVRRRQREGELSADLDPAYVVLTFFAAAMAPTVLPQVVRRLTGLDAGSPEFLDAYAAQLGRVLGHLGGDTPPPD